VLLKDVAAVTIKQSAAGSISRTNGQPSIGISIIKTQQGNTVTVAQSAKRIAQEAQARLGDNVRVTTTLDLSTTITESIDGLTREGITGALVATLAIWVFLLSFRNAIVAAVSIPLSVVVAIIALYFQGFTLNILTLGALTIAVGRVVDDSIVVLENIHRHIQEGDDLTKAVLSGTREVSVAILGATLTTVAVFLPLGFTGGIVGVFFKPFALTVTFALLASLMVALTIVPVLTRMFGGRRRLGTRRGMQAAEKDTVIQKAYTPILRWALNHRAFTLVIAAVAFFSSFALAPLIPTAFLSTPGEKFFQVSVMAIGNTSPEATLEKAIAAEKVIAALPHVVTYDTTITLGGGATSGIAALSRAFQGQAAQGASITVTLEKEADLPAIEQQAREALGALPDAVARVISSGAQSTNSQLQVSVVGDDQASVQAAITQVLEELRGVEGVTDISSAASVALPELAVNVDTQKAMAVGQTPAQVALLIRDLTAGQTVTQVTLPDEGRINVVMRADPAYLRSVDALKGLPVGVSADGARVTLAEIADIQQTLAPAQVTRLNQKVSATVNGVLTAANTGEVNQEVQRRLNALSLPAGTRVEYGGVLQQFQDSFNSLYVSILAAMVIVYLTMVIVMGSLLSPFIIMFSLPLAFVGALAALAVTGRALSISSLFGILMLIGIVVTNGIVLIDFVNQLRRRGYGVRDALMEGGRLRVRPVLMTAVCTVIALIPMSLGFTEGALLATELATVVIGGLVSSTLLTLIVVPVVYSLFEGLRSRLSRSEEFPAAPATALAER
jgi:HAE1 family hydrophobic/amphiphilic exporter-1